MATLRIKQIPVLTDNYVYLLRCTQTNQTTVVDPALAAPVAQELGKAPLHTILNTHHHADHIGGNLELKATYGCKIIGSGYDPERIAGLDQPVKDGDSIFVGDCKAQVMFVPGHTRGHIAFYFPQSEALFCGDTLFAGGCGRLFEGTPEQMFTSLQKIKTLPDNTKIYCAHEYTQNNYKFAHSQAPQNPAITQRLAHVQKLREQGHATVPSTLKEEKRSNVFLMAPNVATFSALRRAKDAF